MTYTLNDLKHLDLMADLEMRKNAEEKAQEFDVKQFVQPTSSFDPLELKLISLCSILRDNGHIKYADDLESKFLLYKKAKTHLYRATDEDGEDLINFSHPDGDAHMAEAADQHGDVETIVSQHKKIVDVLNKQPTGKLANYIAQCKIVLAQDADPKTEIKEKLDLIATNANNIHQAMNTFYGPGVLDKLSALLQEHGMAALFTPGYNVILAPLVALGIQYNLIFPAAMFVQNWNAFDENFNAVVEEFAGGQLDTNKLADAIRSLAFIISPERMPDAFVKRVSPTTVPAHIKEAVMPFYNEAKGAYDRIIELYPATVQQSSMFSNRELLAKLTILGRRVNIIMNKNKDKTNIVSWCRDEINDLNKLYQQINKFRTMTGEARTEFEGKIAAEDEAITKAETMWSK